MIPLETVSISPGSVDGWLEVVAWVTVATILLGLWVLRSYLRYRANDEESRRQLRAIRPQLLAGTSVTVRIRRGFDEGDAVDRIRRGFERSDRLEESDATIRDVGRGLSNAISEARPEWVPVLAWRGILEGTLLAIVGLVAFGPLSVWERAVDPSPPVDASDGATALETAYGVLLSALASFPFSSLISDLVIATGILGVMQLWGSWLIPSIVLIAGGLWLSWLHRTIRDRGVVPDGARVIRSRSRASLRLLMWGFGLWFVGVAIAAPFRLSSSSSLETAGEIVGILAVSLLALYGLAEFITSAASRIAELGRFHPAETSAVVAYLLLRRVYLATALVAAGLIVGYAAHAILSGRILEVLAILGGAPLWVLAVLALSLVSILVIVALQIPDVVEDLRDLSGRISRSSALRLWVFARGIPIVGTVSVFGIVLAMFASLPAAAIAAVATAVALRVIGSLIVRAKYAALRRYSGLNRPVPEVHVAPFTVEDADGDLLWVADVDGKRLIHRHRESLLEDVVDVLRERTESGSWLSTESEHYADRVDMGMVDLERLRTKLRAETRLETRVFVRDSGGEVEDTVAREALLRQYPEFIVDDEITELRRRGILDRRNGRLVLRD